MANSKFYTVEKEIDGVKYIAQFNGMAAALEAIDDCYIEGSSNISTAKLAKYIFDKVIIEPKGLTADDFEDVDSFNNVIRWGRDVMQGKFRKAKDNGATKAKSEK